MQFNYFQKLVEDYEYRLIAQEEKINELNKVIEENTLDTNNRIKVLKEMNEALCKDIEKVRDNKAKNLPRTEEEKEVLQYKLELQKATEELKTKEFQVG